MVERSETLASKFLALLRVPLFVVWVHSAGRSLTVPALQFVIHLFGDFSRVLAEKK